MNAYELANELERFESFNGDVFFGTCAVTLRQQADRIAELEKYEQQIKQMERAYDAHLKKAMGLNDV